MPLRRIVIPTAALAVGLMIAGRLFFSGDSQRRLELVDAPADVVNQSMIIKSKVPANARAVYLFQGRNHDIYVYLRFSGDLDDIRLWQQSVGIENRFIKQALSGEHIYGSPQWFDTESITRGQRWRAAAPGVREEVFVDEARQRVYYLFLTW